MIRIMIVDDHQILRDGLKQMLSEVPDFTLVSEAVHGQEAIEKIAMTMPDVILMDVSMPVMDGVEATARIHATSPNIKILALTMLEQGSIVQLMLRNGASGFLLKDSGKEELVHAIREVMANRRYLGHQAADMLVGNMMRQQAAGKSFIPKLTRREKEVLHLISKGMSDADMAQQLEIGPATIESHRKNLRSKLGARNAAEIVRIAMERGLVD